MQYIHTEEPRLAFRNTQVKVCRDKSQSSPFTQPKATVTAMSAQTESQPAAPAQGEQGDDDNNQRQSPIEVDSDVGSLSLCSAPLLLLLLLLSLASNTRLMRSPVRLRAMKTPRMEMTCEYAQAFAPNDIGRC